MKGGLLIEQVGRERTWGSPDLFLVQPWEPAEEREGCGGPSAGMRGVVNLRCGETQADPVPQP